MQAVIANAVVYLLHAVVVGLGIWWLARGKRRWGVILLSLWVVVALLVPLIDRLWAGRQEAWLEQAALLPETLDLTGQHVLMLGGTSGDARAILHHSGGASFHGMYQGNAAVDLSGEAPVDLYSGRFFEIVPEDGGGMGQRTEEVPEGIRPPFDVMIITDYMPELDPALRRLTKAGGWGTPRLIGDLVVLEIDDPTAFAIAQAKPLLILPYNTVSYYVPPLNPYLTGHSDLYGYDWQQSYLNRLLCQHQVGTELETCKGRI